MNIAPCPHSWQLTPAEAREVQEIHRSRVVLEDRLGPVRRVAGVDVGFEDDNRVARAAVAVLSFPALTLEEAVIGRAPVTFPYIPGLLSFREMPAVLDALRRLRLTPDLLLCDGQGIAHPRRFGIASHLGVLVDIPAIGVAKRLLTGRHDPAPDARGGWTPLRDKGAIIGAVLRTRVGVRPVFISPGHRITLDTALHYVMACVTRYRLPETTRWAHRLASGPEASGQCAGAARAAPR